MGNTIWFNIGLSLFFLVFSFPYMTDRFCRADFPNLEKEIVGIRNRTGRADRAIGREGEVGKS